MDGVEMSRKEMMHVVQLLREDMICNQRIMEEFPFEEEAERSMQRSKNILLKICAVTLLEAYEPSDTETMAERNRLN